MLAKHQLRKTIILFGSMALVPIAAHVVTNVDSIGSPWPAYSKLGSPWYEYHGGVWKDGAAYGIDGAGRSESKLTYMFNFLIGHHGIFSLSPIFLLLFWPLLSLFGCRIRSPKNCVANVGDKHMFQSEIGQDRLLFTLAWGNLVLFLVVFCFYIVFTSNYGGVASGPRWFFWLTPLFLISTIPIADQLGGSVVGRHLSYCLLAISVFSANYGSSNPWRTRGYMIF